MSSVTFPSDLGGDGATYTDDSSPSTGLAAGGHRTRFVPCLSGSVAMAQSAASSALVAIRRNALINGSFEVWNASVSSTSCTAATYNAAAECWYVNPTGAATTRSRSSTVRTGGRTRYSLEVVGATSVTTVDIGQRIEAAVIPHISRQVTFQAYVYNGSGASFTPTLRLGTPGASDDFTTVTNRLSQTLGSCADASWTLVSYTVDISSYTNLAYGLQVDLRIPSGSLVSGDTIRIAEPMLCPAATTSTFETERIVDVEQQCMRYYQKTFLRDTAPAQNVGLSTGECIFYGLGTGAIGQRSQTIFFAVPMRATPTITLYNPAAANAQIRDTTADVDCSSSSGEIVTVRSFRLICMGHASTGLGSQLRVHWTANARLF